MEKRYYIQIVNTKTGQKIMDFENKRSKAKELVLMINSRGKTTGLRASYVGPEKKATKKVIA